MEASIRLVFVGASALGTGLSAYAIVSMISDLARWVLERRRPRWLRNMTRRKTQMKPGTTNSGNIARLILLGAATALALKAAVTGGVVVAAFLIALGIALFLYLGHQAGSTAREHLTDAVAELVSAFYSAYLVIPTVFGALAEAMKTQVDPHLQQSVQMALDGFGAGKTSEEVLDQMVREVEEPYLSQFAFILGHSSESNQREILNSLRDLGNRLEQRRRLKDRSRVALALVSGTVRFLQAANGAVLGLAVLAPFWWGFYASSISRQMLLIIAGTIALLGSWYFENQLTQLKERVL